MPHEQAKLWYIHIVTDICPEWRNPLHADSVLLVRTVCVCVCVREHLLSPDHALSLSRLAMGTNASGSDRLCMCQRTWTPDDESDECALCAEAFTFLNRRHHVRSPRCRCRCLARSMSYRTAQCLDECVDRQCRRCLSLVCAVCSPYTAPLRVFTETATTKRQRICAACFDAMGGSRVLDSHRNRATKQSQMRESDYAMALTDTDDAVSAHLKRHASVRNESSANDDDHSEASRVSTASAEVAAPEPALPSYSLASSSAIHCGTLEFFHGAGFRKSWHAYFFVLLLRKGSLGMFLHAADHVEKKKRPAAVFKLSGYTIRVKAQKRRPHQFRVVHATKKVLHFAAPSIEAMNVWISQFIRAIEVANELEALAPLAMARSPRRGSITQAQAASSSPTLPENDFTEHDNDGNDNNDNGQSEGEVDAVERPDDEALV